MLTTQDISLTPMILDKNDTKRETESGNVIIWILLTIALLAALTFTFTQSSRTSTTMLTEEIADSMARHLLSFSNDVKQAVRRLRLRGCDETEISFENSILGFNYTNPNSPSDNSCHVFDINGGGLQVPTLPETIFDLTHNNLSATYNVAGVFYFRGNTLITDLKTANPELLFYAPYINRDVCFAINDLLGTAEPDPGNLEAGSSNPNPFFVGDYTLAAGDNEYGDQNSALADVKSTCFISNDSDYFFYTVLIPR